MSAIMRRGGFSGRGRSLHGCRCRGGLLHQPGDGTQRPGGKNAALTSTVREFEAVVRAVQLK